MHDEHYSTPGEFMERFRLSRTAVYELLAQGEIRHLRVGRTGKKILIPESGITEWIGQNESGGQEEEAHVQV